MHVLIHTDGGSRGNPGPAAGAFTAHSLQGELLFEASRYLGNTTNNVAEYSALRMAMEWALEHRGNLQISTLEIIMDSELVVKQMRGEYKIKDSTLSVIAQEIKRIERTMGIVTKYLHVRRAENARADELVNICLDAQR